jgi:uncharacterized protein YijF (DUF1287 family)
VPADKGVCTDVVIRAYRKVGIDLQKEIHEDMKANFNQYPQLWGMKKTDTKLDEDKFSKIVCFNSQSLDIINIKSSAPRMTLNKFVFFHKKRRKKDG